MTQEREGQELERAARKIKIYMILALVFLSVVVLGLAGVGPLEAPPP